MVGQLKSVMLATVLLVGFSLIAMRCPDEPTPDSPNKFTRSWTPTWERTEIPVRSGFTIVKDTGDYNVLLLGMVDGVDTIWGFLSENHILDIPYQPYHGSADSELNGGFRYEDVDGGQLMLYLYICIDSARIHTAEGRAH